MLSDQIEHPSFNIYRIEVTVRPTLVGEELYTKMGFFVQSNLAD